MRNIVISILMLNVTLTNGQLQFDTIRKKCSIEIYLVKKVKIDKTSEISLCFWPEKKDLADTAFIKDNEIVGYEIFGDTIHKILLCSTTVQRLKKLTNPPRLKPDSLYPDNYIYPPFAVVVDGLPIYGGWFVSRFCSSSCGDWIRIMTDYQMSDWDGKFKIDLGWERKILQKYGDPRKNKLLLDCLKKSNRLIAK